MKGKAVMVKTKHANDPKFHEYWETLQRSLQGVLRAAHAPATDSNAYKDAVAAAENQLALLRSLAPRADKTLDDFPSIKAAVKDGGLIRVMDGRAGNGFVDEAELCQCVGLGLLAIEDRTGIKFAKSKE